MLSYPLALPPSLPPHLQVRQVSDGLSIELEQSCEPLLVAFIHLCGSEGGKEGGKEGGRKGGTV